ncbi:MULTISPECIES: bifunctional riboflavin kinase/FAD synthetase [unclassified Bacteroides]|jgi:riboflavin kinase/FMN adenylyltransferase|uniref:bifunctional riboflavin kinase/FAD synthetase n=1 Tax=unclassified Bacteroides TaxID=2646097 RepID=UPI000E93B753|nr:MULTISPECIES: bifunctional riboflavin kinase/FAD synthetase [unclassified Bacteroides]RGN42112.1 bifunctional riboflavin kinase/FAD synthetase [Bacteroides sp. OM05-12]RHR68811.1 bifunctional riboflavin kinase/FAD synthetase [Bacteroides sp. AF16-49]
MEIIRDIDKINIEPCVATIGFFDGVHQGHRFLINQIKAVARAKGLRSALVTFSAHPRKVMQKDYQPQLLSTPKEKAELLATTGVDYCIVLDFTPEIARLTACEFMEDILKKKLNVASLVIGYDHRFGHNRAEGFDDYYQYGTKIGMEVLRAKACIINDVNVSSSVIRLLLQEGEIDMATKCLGYNYYLDGTVVDGYKVGRTIGFPTANLKVEDQDKLVPADGVYAVKVTVTGQEYMGMLDIGHRPTFNNGTNKSIEVNILDFNSDIYEQFIRITFIRRIRSDIKFKKVEDLIAQLHRDEAEVRRILQHS